MFRFDPLKLVYDEVLGYGRFGNIYPYRRTKSDEQWVVKHVHARDWSHFRMMIQEIVLGFNLDHPAVLPITGYHVEQSKPGWDFYIKMARMKGTMEDIMNRCIQSKKKIPENELIRYFYTLACGLEYLHGKRIAHGDIKPSNVLFDNEGKLKIADIGIARFVSEDEELFDVNDKAGTPYYTAPEIIEATWQMKNKDLFKADAWALGVVMVELCQLKLRVLKPMMAREDKEEIIRECIEDIRKRMSCTVVDLVARLLKWDPEDRISVKEVREVLESKYEEVLKGESEGREVKDEEKMEEKKEKALREEDLMMRGGLNMMKRGFEKKLQGVFEFGREEILAIKPKEPTRIGDDNVEKLVRDLEEKMLNHELLELTTIWIHLNGCQKITDKTMDTLGTFFGTIFYKMRNLSLRFSEITNITDDGLRTLTTAICNKFSKLTHLSVDLKLCKQITDEGIEEFSLNIGKTLENLEKFTLIVDSCYQVTDFSLESLSKNIFSNLLKLDDISLSCAGCQEITDEGIKTVFQGIGDHLISLKHFSLNLSQCKKVSDQTFEHLSKYLDKISEKTLTFTFDFKECVEITDQGLAILSKFLGDKYSNLRCLSLNFSKCSKLSDEGIKSLAALACVNLTHLQQLILDFGGCYHITDQGVKQLAINLGIGGRGLRRLSLNFFGCKQITDEGIKEVAKQIKTRLLRVQDFWINLEYCELITEETRAELRKATKFVTIANID